MEEIALGRDVVRPFLDHLAKCQRFRRIASHSNSFEGWLKWELVAWLLGPGGIDRTMVDVEVKVLLEQDATDQNKSDKLVDVRLKTSEVEGAPFHYLEIKVIFNNPNQRKQAISAGNDLWYLASMKLDGNAGSIGALAILVGYDDTLAVEAIIKKSMAPIDPPVKSRKLVSSCWALYCEAGWESAHNKLLAG